MSMQHEPTIHSSISPPVEHQCESMPLETDQLLVEDVVDAYITAANSKDLQDPVPHHQTDIIVTIEPLPPIPARKRFHRFPIDFGTSACRRSCIPFWSFIITFTIALVLSAIFNKQLLAALNNLAYTLRSLGIWGHIILALLIFASSFPPLIGYTPLVLLSGYTFHLSGVIPAYIGATTGSIVCFLLSRYLVAERARRVLEKKWNGFAKLNNALKRGGSPLAILIRLGPYPHPLLPILFALSPLSVFQVVAANLIGGFKVAVGVYIGSTLSTLLDSTKVGGGNFVGLGAGVAVGVIGLGVIWLLVRREVAVAEKKEDEGRAEVQEEEVVMEIWLKAGK
ncbi:hypothetical protein HDV05_006174 [Chytridiales sp. JEL 0842]|nr:hypothetical protein HDV05_006174 [Chytridiales sp. JEL 0842]